MTAFSGLVIAFNEEDHIDACVRSLFRVCDDVVVVNSDSIDRTAELAAAGGALVIDQPFLGDGPQRSAGLPHCKHSWVINLDADERLDEDLVEELQRINLDSQHEAYECRRKNHMGRKWIKVAAQYPDYICRVFDRTRTDFSPVRTHSRIVSNKLGKLNGHILHYSFDDLADMAHRMNLYSDWQSQTLFENGKQVSGLAPAGHGLMSFVKFYLIKRGFMAGLDGLTISIFNAMGSYLKYAKLIEKQEQQSRDNDNDQPH